MACGSMIELEPGVLFSSVWCWHDGVSRCSNNLLPIHEVEQPQNEWIVNILSSFNRCNDVAVS